MNRLLFLFTCLILVACVATQATEPALEPTEPASDKVADDSAEQQAIDEDMALVATQTGIEVAELEKQIAHDDAVAALAMQLEANEADTFAGLWIEWEPAYQVVVAFTESGEATVAKYVGEGDALTAVLDIRPATYSYAQLLADQQTVFSQFNNVDFDLAGAVSVQNNVVELTVPSASVWEGYLAENEIVLPPSVVVTFAFDDVAVVAPANLTPMPDVYMAQKRLPSLMFMEALLSANLLLEDGCLFAEEDNGRLLIIWEPGYFAHQGENGRLQILDEAGEVVAEEGQPLYMGGGEGRVPDAETLLAPIPDVCRTSSVWHMGEFLPEEYRNQE